MKKSVIFLSLIFVTGFFTNIYGQELIKGTDDNFNEKVINSELPVVVYFWAEWKSECNKVTPIIKELSKEYVGLVNFVEVNVDNSKITASTFGVMDLPQIVLFKKGEKVAFINGLRTKNFISDWLNNYIN